MSKRESPRASVCLPVSIGGSAAALSADLSASGFCLETMALRAKGEEVKGYVLFGEKELEWRGRVMWVERGNPMASIWHRVGIRFTDVSPGLRALLSIRLRGAK
jgi:hypothetical protein